jgi:hypothetical protein
MIERATDGVAHDARHPGAPRDVSETAGRSVDRLVHDHPRQTDYGP